LGLNLNFSERRRTRAVVVSWALPHPVSKRHEMIVGSRTRYSLVKSAMASPISGRNASSEHPAGFFGWVTQLVHMHRARLFRLVVREGVRADDALDCVQEAFLSFLQLPQARLLVGSPMESARLLSTLARNIARNRRRRHDYARPHVVDEEILQNLPSDAISSDEVVVQAEQHALALGCLVTLNGMQQAVVNLRLVDEVPGDDVALQLGTTREHVSVLLFRARQNLQRCLTG
jgi:RNA polymerase sigma-70 factor (ECF subfamily)